MNTKYRQLMFNAFARLGDKNQAQLMGYYDALASRLGETQAISLLHEAFLQLEHSASASATGYKNLLSQTAKEIWSAIDGKTIKVDNRPAIERIRELQEQAKKQENKELEVEIGGTPRLGLFQTETVLRDNGVLEKHRVYKAVASEKSGLEIEVRI